MEGNQNQPPMNQTLPSPTTPVNPVSGTPQPQMSQPVNQQPVSSTPPVNTPPPEIVSQAQGGGGMNKMFLLIPGVMIVILVLLFVGYFMTMNKSTPEPQVITRRPTVVVTPTVTPTPSAAQSAQEQEVTQVEIGSVDTDLQTINTDLKQL